MLSPRDWDWAQNTLPIACIELIPVQFNSSSEIERIGLIKRLAPDNPAWCLIGGRVRYAETIGEAGQRVLTEAGGKTIQIEVADWCFPDYVAEYLTTSTAGLVDPRKHAISSVYVVTVTGEFKPEGEALAFHWFPPSELPEVLGFGQRRIINEIFGARNP